MAMSENEKQGEGTSPKFRFRRPAETPPALWRALVCWAVLAGLGILNMLVGLVNDIAADRPGTPAGMVPFVLTALAFASIGRFRERKRSVRLNTTIAGGLFIATQLFVLVLVLVLTPLAEGGAGLLLVLLVQLFNIAVAGYAIALTFRPEVGEYLTER